MRLVTVGQAPGKTAFLDCPIKFIDCHSKTKLVQTSFSYFSDFIITLYFNETKKLDYFMYI